jgi:RNA polymerase sigma-70 factor (ECF subfamily)
MHTEITLAYRTYFPLLVRKCARMLGDGHEAEDVAQETFIRFAGSALLASDARAVTAWLYRTSTRLAIDRLRARRRESAQAGDAALAVLFSGDAPDASAELRALLTHLLAVAPEAELEAALLSRVDGLTQLEIGEVLGLHERSVRRLLVRFDRRLDHLETRSEV